MKQRNAAMIRWATLGGHFLLVTSLLGAGQDSLKLRVTFPSRNDTVQTDRIRIAGGTEPGASVHINGKAVRVYRHGAFVSRLELVEGVNPIILRAEKNNRQAVDTVWVFRVFAPRALPPLPTIIDSAFCEPGLDVWRLPGDVLQVTCRASPGGAGRFYPEEGADWLPMVEQKDAAPAGIYRGSVRIPYEWSDRWMQIRFQVCGADSLCAEAAAPGRLRVLPFTTPLVAITVNETQIWTAAQGGAVAGMLPASVKLQIVGKDDRRYRVAFDQTQAFYVNESDLTLLPFGETIRPAAVASPSISMNDDWLKLAMAIDQPIPFLLQQTVDPAMLELTLYGAFQSHPWITFPEEETEIKNIVWSQPANDQLRLRILLTQAQQWGHRVEYEDNILYLLIRRTPRFSADDDLPLKGLNIVVDAGHGGMEPGAISPTGIAEKDVNLMISKSLTQWLRNSGADVTMTRTTDTTMTLRERIETARKRQAHLFLWIHNNSVGAATDAAAVSGTSTYFSLPQNQELAWTVYPHLRGLGLNPFGRIHSSYYVTRTTDMLALLVEAAFMSHPLDEQKLADHAFLRKIAGAVHDGIVEFIRKQNEQSP